MSAKTELAMLLEQWRELTQQEASAIQAAAWTRLHGIQAAKGRLRSAISENMALSPGAKEQFTPVIARLISLETRNVEMLNTQLRRARVEKAALDQVQQNLRRIQRSYAFTTGLDGLNCYS